jgi:hypothetical protein
MGGALAFRSAGAVLRFRTVCGASVLWSWNEGGFVVVGWARCWVSEGAAVVLFCSWVLALVNSAGWLVVV